MKSIDSYYSKLKEADRVELNRIRQLILEIVPETEEVISYGIPGFKYKDAYLVGLAAFKSHLSLFPTSEPIEVFKDQLTEFKLARGTIQFTLEHPLPDELLKQIIQYRRQTIDAGSGY